MYSEKFKHAIRVVLQNEGGYVNHPNDDAGETKYGVTKRSYPNENIKALTEARAGDIYYRDWWTPGPYERIVNTEVATKIFDTAVNMGNPRACKLAQQTVNQLGGKLVVDGAIGPATINAINAADPVAFLRVYRQLQAEHYQLLVRRRPTFSVFLKGWLRRAAS